MRRITVLALAAASLCAAGCTTARSDGSPRIETTPEAKRENLEGVVSSPLRDANLVRTKIPQVLLDAVADPYGLSDLAYKANKPEACQLLEAHAAALDEVLGPDLDVPEEKQGLVHRGRDTAMGFMATAASDAVPFHGWLRQLSGAERHDTLVQNAITAGAVRRAYLKGLGEAHGCKPPATPSHVKAGAAPPVDKFDPLYPIR
jgi:hypothetical protein